MTSSPRLSRCLLLSRDGTTYIAVPMTNAPKPSLLGMSLGRAHAAPEPKLLRLSSFGAGFSHRAPGTYLAGLSVEVGLRPAVVIFGVKEVDQAALAGSVF